MQAKARMMPSAIGTMNATDAKYEEPVSYALA
jgi:hypothetical protein